jgi:hypothetical protein
METSQKAQIEQEKRVEKRATIVDRYVNDGKTRYLKILSDSFRIIGVLSVLLFISHLFILSYYYTGGIDRVGIEEYLEMDIWEQTFEYYIVLAIYCFTPPILLIFFFLRYVFRQVDYENLLRVGGINNAKIIKFTPEYIIFKRLKGQTISIKNIESGVNEICQYLGKYNAHVEAYAKDSFKMVFKDNLPDIDTNIKSVQLKDIADNDKLYLGVKDDKRTAVYTKKSEVRGKMNGHMMIVGTTGSGKSYSFNQIMKNWLNPQSYKELEKIYILNFKDSSDYNPYKKLDKVSYCGNNIRGALKMCKEVELEMMKRYIYNSKQDHDDFPGQKILFIVDEIQTIAEEQGSKGAARIDRNSWDELDSIFKKLASKARAANISLVVILQKGTAENLPGGTTFRDNIRHRFALLNNNMSLLLDAELIEKYNIKADKLKGGQFVYYDNLGTGIQDGFTLTVDYDVPFEKLLIDNDSKEDLKIRQTLDNYTLIAYKAIELAKADSQMMEENGAKTHIDSLSQLQNFEEKDYIELAIKEIGSIEDSESKEEIPADFFELDEESDNDDPLEDLSLDKLNKLSKYKLENKVVETSIDEKVYQSKRKNIDNEDTRSSNIKEMLANKNKENDEDILEFMKNN